MTVDLKLFVDEACTLRAGLGCIASGPHGPVRVLLGQSASLSKKLGS